MGLIDKLRPRMPDLSTKPTTLYRADIQTVDGDSTTFVFLVKNQGVRNKEEIFIEYNQLGFEMPEDAIFGITKRARTKFQGQ